MLKKKDGNDDVAKVGVALTGNTLAVAVARPGAGALPGLVAR